MKLHFKTSGWIEFMFIYSYISDYKMGANYLSKIFKRDIFLWLLYNPKHIFVFINSITICITILLQYKDFMVRNMLI